MGVISHASRRWLFAAAFAFAGAVGATLLAPVRAGDVPAPRNLVAANFTVKGTVMDADGKPAAVDVKLLKEGQASAGPRPRGPNDSPTGDSTLGPPAATPLQKGGGGGGIGKGEFVLKSIKSDSAGNFSFTDVAPGKYVVLAGMGKQAVRQEVEVKNADPAPLALKLTKG